MSSGEGISTTRARILRVGTVVVATVLAVLLVGWAAVQLFGDQDRLATSDPYSLVSVEPGSVGQSIELAVTGSWTSQLVANNAAAGVVTSVDARPGTTIKAGDRLYSVNLRPTVVARGRVPMFRPLAVGVRGPDVTQLQRMLASLGVFSGGPDGVFGAGMEAAVVNWQRSLGVEPTGSVEIGDIVFVATLPMRVFLDDSVVSVGGSVVGGEPVISALSPTPTFQLPVTETQDMLIRKRTKIVIDGPKGARWVGRVAGRQSGEEGGRLLTLTGPNGGAVCRADCGDIPVVGQTLLPSRAVVVPSTEGLVLPSAALLSRAEGSLAVVLADGAQREVSVSAEALGMVVVEGLNEGTQVRVPPTEN